MGAAVAVSLGGCVHGPSYQVKQRTGTMWTRGAGSVEVVEAIEEIFKFI